jgi:hypothetical protein
MARARMVLMLRQTSVSSAVRAGNSSGRRASTVSGRSFFWTMESQVRSGPEE